VALTAGLSCIGATERQAMAWHCVKRYGNFFPAVCSAVNQLKALAS